MREIKFRAWLKDEKKMVEVSKINFIGEEIDVYEDDSSSGNWYGFDNIKLMQYTGIKDKNGADVYEDDVIRIPYLNWGVEDYEYTLVKLQEDYEYYRDFDGTFLFEVLGNIYDNPELLGGNYERNV